MATLQCEITGRFTDPFLLPKDSEVLVTADKGMQATFRTLHDLRVLPITLKKTELALRGNAGFRLLLYFQSSYPRNDAIDTLPVYLNYLNNYHSSLKFCYTLQKHLKKSSVFFTDKIEDNAEGVPCPIRFGSPVSLEDTVNSDLSHPLEQIRAYFHFPQQDLYMNFKVPAPPRNWTNVTICLDLDAKWPKNLSINRDIFQLFTVPVTNLKHNMAQPVLCDGTQDQYAIRYPEPKKKFVLHSVLGTFLIEPDGLIPLRPGIITGGNGSYEIEHNQAGIANLLLHLPQAFVTPKKIAIDALWLQPEFSEQVDQQHKVMLASKNIEGVTWAMLGEIKVHQENPLNEDAEGLLQFLSLQRKPTFTLEEIGFLLKGLGNIAKSPFQAIPQLLDKLEIALVPQSRKIGGVKTIYHLSLKEFDDSYRPLVELFLKKLLFLLQTCSADATVALHIKFADSAAVWELE